MLKPLAGAAIFAAALAYYFFFYPPVVKARAFSRSLSEFTDIVAGKDRAKITEALAARLADDAKIRLEVDVLSVANPDRPPIVQEFDKAAFVRFIDNTLYPLTDYGYLSHVEDFTWKKPSPQGGEGREEDYADVLFTSREWADGAEIYGGDSVNMRFSSDTSCRGIARFTGEMPALSELTCAIRFRAVPKPEEIGKMRNLGAVQELLRK